MKALSAIIAALCLAQPTLADESKRSSFTMAFLRPAAKESQAEVQTPQRNTINAEPVARQSLNRLQLHDPENPDLDKLQSIHEATRFLPYDPNGFPNWMKALNDGLISPRSDLSGTGKMEVLDLDVIMRNTKEMPNVRFPHRSHTLWLACSNCHPAPFKPIAGSSSIRMADIFRGEYCGQCHDRVAFITFFSCDRCHSVPQVQKGGETSNKNR